jgi:thiol-disulfide isomerase/thioredoxin
MPYPALFSTYPTAARHLAGCVALLLALAVPAQAQSFAGVTHPQVQGTTLAGEAFQLESLRGKVVMLMFWSTDCAVCRDKMSELRLNHQGWKDKPFELVLVSTDRKMQDIVGYEKIVAATRPQQRAFRHLWTGQPDYKDNLGKPAVLPATLLIDKTGKVVEQYTGRIPAEAWDMVADLL